MDRAARRMTKASRNIAVKAPHKATIMSVEEKEKV